MFPRFLVVGSLGFAVDAGITYLLIFLGLSPLWARPPAIVLAMVFTWAANRTYTFRAQGGKPARELPAYAAVALVAFGINWGVFAGAVYAGLAPLPAIVLSTLCQTGFTYFGYKKLVFRPRVAERSE